MIHLFGRDGIVGKVMRCLERCGLWEDTLIFVTSDNGGWIDASGFYDWTDVNGRLRGQKGEIYEGGHRVPFIARWPRHVPEGTVCEEMISLVDIMATLAALTGIALPEDAAEDSFNMLPALLDPYSDHEIRKTLIHHTGGEEYAVREGPWKLVLTSNTAEASNLAAESSGELYNLMEDLGERNDLSRERPEIVSRLIALLETSRGTGRSRPLLR